MGYLSEIKMPIQNLSRRFSLKKNEFRIFAVVLLNGFRIDRR